MRTCLPSTQLHDLLDGALSPPAAGRTWEHLRSCARCRDAWRLLIRVDGFTARATRAPVEPEDVALVWRRACRNAAQPTRLRAAQRPRVPFLAAAVASLVVALLALLPLAGETSRPQVRAATETLDRAAKLQDVLVALEPLLDRPRAAEGFADNKPVKLNDTPGGRAQNRRVDLVYLRQATGQTLVQEADSMEEFMHQETLKNQHNPFTK